MKSRFFKIAGGNETALIWGSINKERSHIVSNLMRAVEQVGFIDDRNGLKINMMGDELCINACIAAGFAYPAESSLKINGNIVQYQRLSSSVELKIKLKNTVIQGRNIVLFDKIGYIFLPNQKIPSKKEVSSLAEEFNLPAFGAIKYRGEEINPYVYVKKSDTYVRETACGSGSIAAFLLKGVQLVKQPTGETISVGTQGDYFFVEAEVKEILMNQ